MIEEDYVSYEVAELLKEKGFDELCSCLYNKKTMERTTPREYVYNGEWEAFILCPTLQMTMKWLREEHKIILCVYYCDKAWQSEYYGKEDSIIIGCDYKTYEEACESAIKYALENLI